ncbi:hypothetical protein FN846DRAFT_903710 [Sphaerosporella brunnea]|uniref:Uncharacterized protein n=1 Tax=Sphaerosporella brunnea TaxID=1250544 RepID=A0A5J5F763_9PEZI|nr:hypothetical protein FN846DRAFT_903710 [Sphaerosporella brunnea]
MLGVVASSMGSLPGVLLPIVAGCASQRWMRRRNSAARDRVRILCRLYAGDQKLDVPANVEDDRCNARRNQLVVDSVPAALSEESRGRESSGSTLEAIVCGEGRERLARPVEQPLGTFPWDRGDTRNIGSRVEFQAALENRGS